MGILISVCQPKKVESDDIQRDLRTLEKVTNLLDLIIKKYRSEDTSETP